MPDRFGLMSTTDVAVLVDGASSGGKLSVFTETAPPGRGPPPHSHGGEAEHLVPIEDLVEVFVGVCWAPMPKEGVFVPVGQVHTWRDGGDAPSTVLRIFSPSSFEELMQEIAGSTFGEADLGRVAEATARAGTTVCPSARCRDDGAGPGLARRGGHHRLDLAGGHRTGVVGRRSPTSEIHGRSRHGACGTGSFLRGSAGADRHGSHPLGDPTCAEAIGSGCPA